MNVHFTELTNQYFSPFQHSAQLSHVHDVEITNKVLTTVGSDESIKSQIGMD